MRKIQGISFIMLFLSSCLFSHGQAVTYSANSVLSSGIWLKMPVITEGIYRIDYSVLRQNGLSDPSNPRIFCNNAGQLSYYNDNTAPDDLREIAIFKNTGSDGIFNEGDYLLFYGRGTHRWIFNQATGKYSLLRHNYSDTAFYFITSQPGEEKIISDYSQPAASPGYSSNSSDAFFYHEIESENLIKSGREWFQKASPTSAITINPGFTGLITTEKLKVHVRVAARSSTSSEFTFGEGSPAKKISLPGVSLFNTSGMYAAIADSAWNIDAQSQTPSFALRFDNNGNEAAAGWLDYVRIQVRVSNIFSGQYTSFMDSRSVSPGMVTAFAIESPGQNPLVWDVTDPFNIQNVSYLKDGNNLRFTGRTDTLRKYAVFLPSNARSVIVSPAIVPNQDLHGSPAPEMIILTHPMFRKYANEIAEIHRMNSGLVSQVVTLNEVYNEFSGGTPDIAGLRNFFRMKYMKQRGTSTPLKYLLLFGDGSYENKTPPPANPNYIPTYQSQNSNVVISSFTSDDFYGLLEDGEGESDGTEDIGIGRLPVSDTSSARIIVDRIREYLDPVNHGDWKSIIALVADDEDGNAHMTDAEGLELVLKEKAPEYFIDKIYLDAYKQVTSANGQSYPDVTRAINDRMNEGCLIFNYTGHGNELFLAHERILTSEDYMLWRNLRNLPLVITATCEFSRFDDVDISVLRDFSARTSAGEKILTSEQGGAIALMSTTRLVFSSPNFFLNRNIFDCAFDKDSLGNPMRLGDIIRKAKNNSGTGNNKRNFSLLGDPALRLAYPWHGKVITDSINSKHVSSGIDTLKALSLITVSGHIEDNNGKPASEFNGIVSPRVFDKERRIRALANDGGPVMEFGIQDNILFSGKTRAENGVFKFSFIVPRDMDYSFGNGKITYYANDSVKDMNGVFRDIIAGGFANTEVIDNSGPRIRLFMNDTLFRDGGLTDKNPVLMAIIEDPCGINITGSGIGHDLTGYTDENRNSPVILNDRYVNDFDSYTRGRVTYKLSDLDEGSHTFTLRAWDNFNNSSEETISFIVGSGDKFILRNIYNYPNPFLNSTTFTGEMNRPDEPIEISLVIYSLNGTIIKSLKFSTFCTGYVLPPVEWDGTDDGGNRIARGMYPYIVRVRTDEGETAVASGKLIIL